ncbi:acetoin utilization AcuB family protein [Bacillus sp. 31A1R]|uniref:Acetoin utilization AcuB family protein n=1 Tax=Robertmurraya mangrovi TaxID=3098077 RepID=A0ABU5IZE7_9BACI|nr:acetoin utilization AcuB family protein [Bacillus sp. 31A1R]MDZ5472543.1 acetoin utilization AcuB family protein [Bacillus sp. 31A1R]
MIVEEIMKVDISTLTPNDSIADAIQLMKEKKIRHIPIVDQKEQIVGIVTDRDIKEAISPIFHYEEHKEDLTKTLGSIMSTNILTAHPLDFVEEIAALFYEHKVGCLPIIQEQKLVGIVTETDLLHTLVELTGAHQPGSQIEVKVPNKAGMLCEITSVIRDRKANIQSVLVYPYKKDPAYKILVLRVQTMNPLSLIEDLKNAGHCVLWPNLPGMDS